MSLKLKTESYIQGGFQAISHKKFDVINPSTGEKIIEISDDGVDGINKSIEAAQTALSNWKNKTAIERSLILKKWNGLILENQNDLAKVITMESGKPINESKGEVLYGASFIEWFAEEAKRTYGDIIPGHGQDKRIQVIKQPIGVVGAITPWNFPLAMITRKIAPALAAGCTVIVRPSEETPLTALLLAELTEQAGFPPGVINIVVGLDASEMGKALCEAEEVKKISFTGSTRVGQILMQQCSPGLKKLSLELGGNAPFIVFDSANIKEAITGAIASKFRNSGQTCVCTNRFLIQDDIYDEFIVGFLKEVKNLSIGSGEDPKNHIGALINQKAVEKVNSYVQDATQKGSSLLLGGNVSKGLFYHPTVLSDVTQDMIISQEEVFGPVAAFTKFKNEDEAIALANNTKYGLASYFYTNDLNQSIRVSEKLEYGMVGLNTGLISTTLAPFGGVKASGQGREGSKYGIEDFLEIKYICTGNVK